MLRKTLSSTPTTIGDRTARFVISDESVDRQNEQVVQSGGDFSLYLQNPVVLYGHDPMFPIGTGANIRRDGTKTIADLTLAPPGVSQKADEVWGLIKVGHPEKHVYWLRSRRRRAYGPQPHARPTQVQTLDSV